MTQEEKQLLLADLCARLPYRVKVQTPVMNDEITLTCEDISAYFFNPDNNVFLKPFLRPMSSMTEEERKEWKQLLDDEDFARPFYHDDNSIEIWINRDSEYDLEIDFRLIVETIDWLNAHHFDYRGLIEKGLALEAPKGMYKMEE